MKIVVLDGYTLNPGDLDWKAFEALGELEVHDRTHILSESVLKNIGDAEIVFTNKTDVPKREQGQQNLLTTAVVKL